MEAVYFLCSKREFILSKNIFGDKKMSIIFALTLFYTNTLVGVLLKTRSSFVDFINFKFNSPQNTSIVHLQNIHKVLISKLFEKIQ